jgi:hypothetical protein
MKNLLTRISANNQRRLCLIAAAIVVLIFTTSGKNTVPLFAYGTLASILLAVVIPRNWSIGTVIILATLWLVGTVVPVDVSVRHRKSFQVRWVRVVESHYGTGDAAAVHDLTNAVGRYNSDKKRSCLSWLGHHKQLLRLADHRFLRRND